MTNKMQPLVRKKKSKEKTERKIKFDSYVYVVIESNTDYDRASYERIDGIFKVKDDANKYCKKQNKKYETDRVGYYVEKIGVR